MQKYALNRFFQSFVSLFVLLAIVFVVTRATGDPVALMAPPEATAEDLTAMRKAFGLDKPIHMQFLYWLKNLATGDLGKSVRSRIPVNTLLKQRIPSSLKLAAVALTIAMMIAFPLGIIAAVKKDTVIDLIARFLAILGQSMPAFWLGLLLMQFFAIRLELLPTSGIGGPEHYLLPAFTLGWYISAGFLRLLRSGMLDALDKEYTKLARVKGASEQSVVLKHALANALIPVVSFAGVYFVLLITAAIVVEVVFSWPGMGRLAYEAIMVRDFPVIQGVVLAAGIMVIVANLTVDILYCYLDPRIRYD
jgi:peptide/nickel transport system permease protein